VTAPHTDPDAPVRVGFLGAGLIATFHSKMLHRSGVQIERSGVFDVDPSRAAVFAEASGCVVAHSEQELIERSDAVYVCTWTSEHLRLLTDAVARGRHVFCEKPLAVDLAGAEAMLATVTRAEVVHQVGLVLRRSPAFLMARHLVQDRAAGAPMAVVFRDDQYIPIQGHYGSHWRADRSLAGAGTLLEHSIHDVDLLHMIVGDIESVTADCANHHGHEGIEDVVTATIRFTSGALGTLTSVWHDNLARPSLRRVEVFCERRHVVVDGHDWFGPVTWADADGTTGTLEGPELVAQAQHLLADGLSLNPDGDFVRAVHARSPATPDLSVAVAAHRVVDAMYRSAARGGGHGGRTRVHGPGDGTASS
jgi:UDP-N-acetyl-2-amino-2-deoxyglucuronate dehydrogenase